MDFPDPLPLRAEAAFGAAPDSDPGGWMWTDLSADLDGATPVGISRGRQDEASDVAPGSARLRLRNQHGHYTPGNPLSAHYPHVRKGTPVRVWVELPDLHRGLRVSGSLDTATGSTVSYASTPDHPSLQITGDIDVRADLEPVTWRPAAFTPLAGRFLAAGNQMSWALGLRTGGGLSFTWSVNGTDSGGNRHDALSTDGIPATTGRLTVRAVLDVDNGAGGHTVTFFTAPTLAGPWSQLGAAVTGAGTTSIFAGSAELAAGSLSNGTSFTNVTTAGELVGLQVRDGIDGTVVAHPDFAAQDAGTRQFTDSPGRMWTVQDGAWIFDDRIRFLGQVVEWAPTWPYGDLSTQDDPGESVVDVAVAGLLQRLGQGASPLRSALYRGLTGQGITTPRAYWPCEDGTDATNFASGLGHSPLTVAGEVERAAFSDIAASGPIPKYANGFVYGAVRPYPRGVGPERLRMMALVAFPDSITGAARIMRVDTANGNVIAWWINVDSAGNLRIQAADLVGNIVVDAIGGFDVLGQRGFVWIYLTQTVFDITWQLGFANESTGEVGVISDVLSPYTFAGVATGASLGGNGDLNGTAVGHVVILDTEEFFQTIPFLRGWAGETAAARMARLSAEEGSPLRLHGDPNASQRVGPQRVDTYLALMREAASVDGGLLSETRDTLALEYRSGATLSNQAVRLALDAASAVGGDITHPFAPVDDDQAIRNDITVSRVAGSSARVTDELHIIEHGRYDESVTVNAYADHQLDDLAGWRLRLGTWPGMRYPAVSPALDVNPALIGPWTRVALGDRVHGENLPPQHPPGPVALLVQGYTETLDPHRWAVEANTTPADPWTALVLNDNVLSHLDTDSSELSLPVDDSDPVLSVATVGGPLWTVDASEFPFDIELGGEFMTVTGISGASSPQTFSVTRGRNGIAKAHPAGTAVRLASHHVLALT